MSEFPATITPSQILTIRWAREPLADDPFDFELFDSAQGLLYSTQPVEANDSKNQHGTLVLTAPPADGTYYFVALKSASDSVSGGSSITIFETTQVVVIPQTGVPPSTSEIPTSSQHTAIAPLPSPTEAGEPSTTMTSAPKNVAGIVAGAVICAVVLLTSILGGSWLYRRRRRQQLALVLPHPMSSLSAIRPDNPFEPPISTVPDSRVFNDTPLLVAVGEEQAPDLFEQEKPPIEDDNQQPRPQPQPDPTTVLQIPEEDSSAITTLRAGLLALRHRLVLLESVEAEDPPNYVSLYTHES
ncbi:hypothetical protein PQX77_018247 [Marasmius sp. AFHP31]|nr:hypothetical protein PQX77_018247 [Marasmius sp. AFHP31]